MANTVSHPEGIQSTIIAIASRSTTRRLLYATLATLLLAAALAETITHRTGYWQLGAFMLGPDIALFSGLGADREKGRLHPRAVPLYNLLHHYWLPLLLFALASFDAVPLGFLVGALAWCFHISLDRGRLPSAFARRRSTNTSQTSRNSKQRSSRTRSRNRQRRSRRQSPMLTTRSLPSPPPTEPSRGRTRTSTD